MGKQSPSDLRQIPGIGPRMEEDLQLLGYRAVSDLAGADAEEMYDRLCKKMGCALDRCVLYVFARRPISPSRKKHDPELLKWWNWSDENIAARRKKTKRK